MEKKDKKNEQKKWKRQKNLGKSESGREVHSTEKKTMLSTSTPALPIVRLLVYW